MVAKTRFKVNFYVHYVFLNSLLKNPIACFAHYSSTTQRKPHASSCDQSDPRQLSGNFLSYHHTILETTFNRSTSQNYHLNTSLPIAFAFVETFRKLPATRTWISRSRDAQFDWTPSTSRWNWRCKDDGRFCYLRRRPSLGSGRWWVFLPEFWGTRCIISTA